LITVYFSPYDSSLPVEPSQVNPMLFTPGHLSYFLYYL